MDESTAGLEPATLGLQIEGYLIYGTCFIIVRCDATGVRRLIYDTRRHEVTNIVRNKPRYERSNPSLRQSPPYFQSFKERFIFSAANIAIILIVNKLFGSASLAGTNYFVDQIADCTFVAKTIRI